MFDNPASTGLDPDERLLERRPRSSMRHADESESYHSLQRVAAEAGRASSHLGHPAASP